MSTEKTQAAAGARIKRLSIERYRGLDKLTWYPGANVNLIIGGGDVGKTTILDAISLLFSPISSTTISDVDYRNRETENGFEIEAVISLPDDEVNHLSKMVWPWVWDGKELKQPALDDEPSAQEPAIQHVYCVRVRGTPDLDLIYEICNPDETYETFTAGLRRKIGLVKLSGEERNDRDLRLVQGSALDALLSDKGLRGRLGQQFAGQDVQEHLKVDAKEALQKLDKSFLKEVLPSGLGLGLVGGYGFSIGSLIGLTAIKGEVSLPVSSWGAGTRRLASLTVAGAMQTGAPFVVIDELERGLEPYRQRGLVKLLFSKSSQVFLTTHSSTVLSEAAEATLWYVDASGHIGELPKQKISSHQAKDPEAFLARLTIVGEGITEVGFAAELIERSLNGKLGDYGIWITDAGGNDAALELLEAFAQGHLKFGGLVDYEGRFPERWKKVGLGIGSLILQWKEGCLEKNIIELIDDECLEKLIEDPEAEKTGDRLRTLADRLGIHQKDFQSIRHKAGGNLKQLIIDAATGAVPADVPDGDKKAFKKHSTRWFKSNAGGRELARKIFSLKIWPDLKPQLLPFLNSIRENVGLKHIKDIQL
ncbi:ATP-dependent nuclease [Methylorubrum sp. SL192]|uniref:ATP-dependent nuclease n=1 Tax=Methylorubrum sp. SL192 TaxID=2995167 RepID=UPI0022757018|nr:ATP-binding protein [Methylorubrum sp. SL192]MCY1640690.1 AAA family ATPase [Methylorubrum sp. SL192]